MKKKFYLIGTVIILVSFIFAFSTSSVLAAGCEKNQESFSFSKFLNPFTSFVEKVANNFGYQISLAAPVSCSANNCVATCDVGCSGATPTVTISWPSAGVYCTNYYILTVPGVGSYQLDCYTLSHTISSGLASNTTYTWSVEAYYTSFFGGIYGSAAGSGVINQPYGSFTTSNCEPTITIDNVTISSPTVLADNSTQYTINVYGSSSGGSGTITDLLALINYQGTNAGQYRGYLMWGQTSPKYCPYCKDLVNCSGGGQAAVYNGYGASFIHLDSCSASSSGSNQRIASFGVRFSPSFTSPTTDNNISGYVATNYNRNAGWTNFPGFDLALPPGDFTLSSGSGSGSATCNSVPLSWTDSSGADGYRILKGSARVDITPYQPYTAFSFTDTTVSQNTTYIYQIEAYNDAGTNRSNAINITTPFCPPTVSLSANPTSIFQGRTSTLTWSSTYADSCIASAQPSQSDWSGNKDPNGGKVVIPSPPPSVAYNLTCSGGGGSASASTIINVAPLLLPDWREIIPR